MWFPLISLGGFISGASASGGLREVLSKSPAGKACKIREPLFLIPMLNTVDGQTTQNVPVGMDEI